MRVLVLVAVLAGCNAGDWVVGWGGTDACPGAWSEQIIAKTRAGEVVAATRDGCGFPDAETDYRLYRDGVMFAEGNMQTNHWVRAVTRDAAGTTFWLYDQRCVLGEAALTCVRCSDDDIGRCAPRL
jgi:hypothetical protein